MRTLKLMADYECFPIWEASPGEIGNVDPASLPISPALVSRLDAWAAAFDETLNQDDPVRSGFPSRTAEEEFRAEQQELCEALQTELGAAYVIIGA